MIRSPKIASASILIAVVFALGAGAQEAKSPAAKATPVPAATVLPIVDQILEKYVAAVGGKAAIEKITSRVTKGTFEIPAEGIAGTLESYAKAPNKAASVVDIPGFGQIRQGFDGAEGWASNPQEPVRVLQGQELSIARRAAELRQALKLRELYPKMTLKGTEKVGDRETYVIEADPGDGSLRRMYLDAQTALLLRNDIERDTPSGRATSESYLSEYREMDGVKFPFTLRQVNPNVTFVIKLAEVKHNVPVDDAVFAKPGTP